MPRFRIWKAYEYARVTKGPKYATIWLNIWLKQWLKNTNLVFYCKKTKSMLCSTHKMSQHHQPYNSEILKINCNNQTIEIIKQFKLLGVVVEEHFERYIHIFIIIEFSIIDRVWNMYHAIHSAMSL